MIIPHMPAQDRSDDAPVEMDPLARSTRLAEISVILLRDNNGEIELTEQEKKELLREQIIHTYALCSSTAGPKKTPKGKATVAKVRAASEPAAVLSLDDL